MERTVAPQRARVSPIILGNQRHQRIALGSQLGHASKAPFAEPVAQQGAVFEVQFPQLAANGVEFDASHRWPFRWLVPHQVATALRGERKTLLTHQFRTRTGASTAKFCIDHVSNMRGCERTTSTAPRRILSQESGALTADLYSV